MTAARKRQVYVIDDEQDVRVALSIELRAGGYQSRPFASADDFLDALPELQPGCVMIDVRMPVKNGLELLAELAERGIGWPAIMMTGHAEVVTAVEAMKFGAVEFLEKPFSEPTLEAALGRAFKVLDDTAGRASARQEAQARLDALTPREREIFSGIVAGLANKELAARLELSTRTVEMHRANLMKKLGVSSLYEMLSIAAEAGAGPLAGGKSAS